MEPGKLVRDRIPEIIERAGGQPCTRALSGESLRRALEAKLREETDELIAAPTQDARAQEAADVLEVLKAIAAFHRITWERIELLAHAKRTERGAFDAGLWLADPLGQTGGDDERSR